MPTDTTATPLPRPGRPRSLDEAKRREICALVSAGCRIVDAARYVHCAPSTIHRERRLNDEFRAQLRRAEVTAQLQPLRAMQKAVSTHWRAAAWMLERTQPDRFARQSPLAFGPKQARALIDDIVTIINEEILDSSRNDRLKKRVVAAMHYAMRAAWDTHRTNRNLRRAMELSSQKDRAPFLPVGLPESGFVFPPEPKSSPPKTRQTFAPSHPADKSPATAPNLVNYPTFASPPSPKTQ